MEITAAIICDYAQVRDRLLFVSSGAVSRLYRDTLPTVLGVNMALIVKVGAESAGLPQKLAVAVVNRHGRELSRVVTTFRVGDDGLFPNEIQQVPMVVNVANTPVLTWGTHQFRIYLNDVVAKTATCYVIPTSGVFDEGLDEVVADADAPPAPAEPAAEVGDEQADADADAFAEAGDDAGSGAEEDSDEDEDPADQDEEPDDEGDDDEDVDRTDDDEDDGTDDQGDVDGNDDQGDQEDEDDDAWKPGRGLFDR